MESYMIYFPVTRLFHLKIPLFMLLLFLIPVLYIRKLQFRDFNFLKAIQLSGTEGLNQDILLESVCLTTTPYFLKTEC